MFRENFQRTSNCGFLEFKELVPDEPNDEAGLADGGVAQKDQLEVAYPISAHGWLRNSLLSEVMGRLLGDMMFSR